MSITALEAQRKNLVELQELHKAHNRLMQNRDFKKLILENFIVHDCARNVAASVDPKLDPENRQAALEMAKAAGYLKHYLQVTASLTERATSDLADLDAAIEQARQEEAQAGADDFEVEAE